jgi:hypothetical protein
MKKSTLPIFKAEIDNPTFCGDIALRVSHSALSGFPASFPPPVITFTQEHESANDGYGD